MNYVEILYGQQNIETPVLLLLSSDNINICGWQSSYWLVNCCHMVALISVTDFLKHKQE
jgi:hypothetical protein